MPTMTFDWTKSEVVLKREASTLCRQPGCPRSCQLLNELIIFAIIDHALGKPDEERELALADVDAAVEAICFAEFVGHGGAGMERMIDEQTARVRGFIASATGGNQ